jgi:hypothetical protein
MRLLLSRWFIPFNSQAFTNHAPTPGALAVFKGAVFLKNSSSSFRDSQRDLRYIGMKTRTLKEPTVRHPSHLPTKILLGVFMLGPSSHRSNRESPSLPRRCA